MNYYLNCILISLLPVFVSCGSQEIVRDGTNRVSVAGQNNDLEGNVRKPSAANEDSPVLIKGFEGVVTLDKGIYSEDDSFIVFENADGSKWYRFTFYYDDSDGKFEFENKEFLPIGFHPDYFVLDLKCRNESSERYEVVVNEASGLTKYLPKDKRFKFRSWDQYIESAYAIDLPPGEVYFSKDGKIDKDISTRTGFFYKPIRAEGYWLEIRLTPVEPSAPKKREEVRWIKWRDDTHLFVSTLIG